MHGRRGAGRDCAAMLSIISPPPLQVGASKLSIPETPEQLRGSPAGGGGRSRKHGVSCPPPPLVSNRSCRWPLHFVLHVVGMHNGWRVESHDPGCGWQVSPVMFWNAHAPTPDAPPEGPLIRASYAADGLATPTFPSRCRLRTRECRTRTRDLQLGRAGSHCQCGVPPLQCAHIYECC